MSLISHEKLESMTDSIFMCPFESKWSKTETSGGHCCYCYCWPSHCLLNHKIQNSTFMENRSHLWDLQTGDVAQCQNLNLGIHAQIGKENIGYMLCNVLFHPSIWNVCTCMIISGICFCCPTWPTEWWVFSYEMVFVIHVTYISAFKRNTVNPESTPTVFYFHQFNSIQLWTLLFTAGSGQK